MIKLFGRFHRAGARNPRRIDGMNGRLEPVLVGSLISLVIWAAAPANGHAHHSYQSAPRKLLESGAGAPVPIQRSCGHVPPTPDERQERAAFLAPFMRTQKAVRRRGLTQAGIVINIYWHINRLGGAGPLACRINAIAYVT